MAKHGSADKLPGRGSPGEFLDDVRVLSARSVLYATRPKLLPTFVNAATARSICASSCAALI